MGIRRDSWTDEEFEIVRSMWDDHPASKIAREMSARGFTRTRSAVIGAAHRMQLRSPDVRRREDSASTIDSIVRKLWIDGIPASEIVTEIYRRTGVDVVHGTVSKIAHGLGLKQRIGGRPQKQASQAPARPTSTGLQTKGRAAAEAVNGVGGAAVAAAVSCSSDAAQVENSTTMAPGARIVPLLEIQHGECRFVVEESPYLMCGAPAVNGGVWCAFHHRLVYVPKAKVAREIHRINSVAKTAVAQNPSTRILQCSW